jgi:hypothetical protein
LLQLWVNGLCIDTQHIDSSDVIQEQFLKLIFEDYLHEVYGHFQIGPYISKAFKQFEKRGMSNILLQKY